MIVIGALSQNVAELPLAKAYLERPDGSQVVLKRLGLVKKTLKAPSQAAKIFGPNVSEEFYLVPASVLGRGAMLKCDFAKNRLGFVLVPILVASQRACGTILHRTAGRRRSPSHRVAGISRLRCHHYDSGK